MIYMDSLRRTRELPAEILLPGHGEQTSIGRERATNPFLLSLVDDGDAARVTRGL